MKARLITVAVLLGLLLPTTAVWGQDGRQVSGTINDDAPFTRIPVRVDQAGSTIIADIQPTSGDLDTLLYLVDSDEQIVAENDDRSKDDISSRIEFPQADAGDYSLIATRYKAAEGDSSGDFALTVDLAKETDEEVYHTAAADLEAAGYPAIEPEPPTKWTVLVYYGGDNNLEPGILNDLDEFEVAGGSMADVNIVALVDRNPSFTDSNGDWDTTRLFKVSRDVSQDHTTTFPPTIDTEALADLGEKDTGDGETLAQFLVWGVRNFPADHYAVAFGSHGAAWQGLVTDDTSEANILSIPELQRAFQIAIDEAGVDEFDLLINDACLMSSVEYFQGVAPYFHYSLASPEIVIDPALDMTYFTNLLKSGDELDLAAAGTTLVDLYITRDIFKRESSDIVYLTHAVTNLDNFDPVAAAVENFAQIANRSPAVYATMLGEARANTYTYTSFLSNTTRVDLGSLMRRVLALTTDSDLIEAANKVLVALDQARIYGNAGEYVISRTSYYNIYFPDSSKDFKVEYFEQSPLKEWGKLLRNYYNSVTPQVWTGGGLGLGFHLPIAPQIRITSMYPENEINLLSTVIMGLEIVGRRIAYGDSTVDQIQPDGSARRLSSERLLETISVDDQVERVNRWRPGVEGTRFFWDVLLPVITDGTSRNNELLIFTEDVAFLDGRYREPGSDVWNDVGVMFSLDGKVQRIVNHAAESDALGVIDIAPGSEFQAYSSVVTSDGRVTAEPGNLYTWPRDGLTWSWNPAPNGEYNIGLLITAFGGTTGFTSRTVTVNNIGLNPELRGETRTDFGFTVSRLSDWSPLAYFPENRWMRTSSPDEADNLTVYFSSDVGSDLNAIARRFLEKYDRRLQGTITETSVAGVPALELRFTYDTDQGTMNGHALALFHETRGIGMIFAAEALEDVGDLDTTFAMVRDNLAIIDLQALNESDTSAWYFDSFVPEVQYPVRVDWESGSETGGWTRYAPDGDAGTFVSLTRMETARQSASELLDDLVTVYVQSGVENFESTGRLYYGQSYTWYTSQAIYHGPNHTWEAALYTAERDGQPVIGRMYATIFNDYGYALWVETPDTEEAATVFADTFEPMLDGFMIGEPEE